MNKCKGILNKNGGDEESRTPSSCFILCIAVLI